MKVEPLTKPDNVDWLLKTARAYAYDDDLPPDITLGLCAELKRAREQEREACAKLAESFPSTTLTMISPTTYTVGSKMAEAIRARGEE